MFGNMDMQKTTAIGAIEGKASLSNIPDDILTQKMDECTGLLDSISTQSKDMVSGTMDKLNQIQTNALALTKVSPPDTDICSVMMFAMDSFNNIVNGEFLNDIIGYIQGFQGDIMSLFDYVIGEFNSMKNKIIDMAQSLFDLDDLFNQNIQIIVSLGVNFNFPGPCGELMDMMVPELRDINPNIDKAFDVMTDAKAELDGVVDSLGNPPSIQDVQNLAMQKASEKLDVKNKLNDIKGRLSPF